jgi:predicted DNA-binding transcriptional regulator YafY
VLSLQESVVFIALAARRNPAIPDLLRQLRRAILERRTVRFTYHARHRARGPDATADGPPLLTRRADPYALAQVEGAWYLVAHCHERGAIRRFRLDRIDDLELLSSTFTRPAGFRPEVCDDDNTRAVTVRALFDDTVSRWVRESPSFFQVGAEERPDGLLVTLRVREEEDTLHWLLSWGSNVRVLEPDSLRQRLAEVAAAILRNHADAAGRRSSKRPQRY